MSSKNTKPVQTEKSYLGIYSLPDENKDLVERCVKEIDGKLLKNPPIIVYGRQAYQHRSIGFFSNESEGYRYSGQLAESQAMTPGLSELLEIINNMFQAKFNGILVNRYENGEDTIGAHSDDEKFLDPVGVVCISWGESRTFRIRNKQTKEIVKDIQTEPNKIIHMAGDFQKEFTHEIPMEKKKKNPRVSFTFRRHLQ
jgi:alkylated DNA repair dioxygenase AlkB